MIIMRRMSARTGFFACAFAAMAGAAHAAEDSETRRRFEFVFETTVTEIPDSAKTLKVWIPLPRTDAVQFVESLAIESPLPWSVVAEPVHGNRFASFAVRENPPAEFAVRMRATVIRRAYRGARAGDAESFARPGPDYLAPGRLVRTDGKVASEARDVAGRASDPLTRARLLYDHIVSTVVYDKSGEGWGLGSTDHACTVRRGNCTDFHSLFMGEARALGLPARFLMGFPLPADRSEGEIGGYHCWAEFSPDGESWLALDASEAFKHPEKRDELFGGLDAHRIHFTTGRDIDLPGSAQNPHNYIIYPVVEVDGAPFAGVAKNFSFRELP